MTGTVLFDRFAQRRPEASSASVVAMLTGRPVATELAALDEVSDGLELRADLFGDLDPGWLRSLFCGTLPYALPNTALIDGRKVLAAETGSQFRLMTGRPLPADAVGVALG